MHKVQDLILEVTEAAGYNIPRGTIPRYTVLKTTIPTTSARISISFVTKGMLFHIQPQINNTIVPTHIRVEGLH